MTIPLRSISLPYRSRTALIHRGRAFTGEALDGWATGLADRLSSLGIGAQHRVAIVMGNTPEFVVSVLAAMKLRASSVLFGTHFRDAEIVDAVRRTNSAVILSTAQASTHLDAAAAHLSAQNVDDYRGPLPITILQTSISSAAAAEEELFVQFTSGVLGHSKIIARLNSHLQDELESFEEQLGLSSEDATVCPAPLFHAYGLVNGFLLPFFSGRPAILVDWFLPNDAIDVIRTHRARLFVGVPTMYKAMAEAYGATRADLESLRICFSAGAPLTQRVFDAFYELYGKRIHQQYGSTETGVMTVNLLDGEHTNFLSVGRPLRRREIDILAEDGSALPPGAPGEIVIRSPAAATKYLDHAVLTADKFRDGRFFTADIGQFDEHGQLLLTGRRASFINVAGLKVDPREVENVLTEIESVVECAVVPTSDQSGGWVVKAFVVTKRELSEREVQRFCRRRLASHKVPRRVEFVDALPRTATGKVLLKYLLD
jgi:long-chain acyl-CoA synthetase